MRRTVLRALLSHWQRHPVQLATLMLGLALATALWSGVQAINSEARRSYAEAAGAIGQDQLDRLTGAAISTEDFVALRRAGWQVSPVVEGRRDGFRILGVDPLSAPSRAGLEGLLTGTADLAAFLTAPGLLLASEDMADVAKEWSLPAAMIGGLPPGTLLADIPVAQRLLNRNGFSYLLIAAEQPMGLPPLAEVTRLTREGPPQNSALAQLTDSFHLNLTAFGFLAFAVGLFIVQSAIGLAFEQRRSTFRTLRALGVDLKLLLRLLALELSVLALIAGLLGLLLGYAIAAALLPGVSGTLRSLYGAQMAGSLSFDPLWALAGLGMTLAGAAAAGALALWRVAQLPLLAPAQPRAWARASQRQMRLQALAGLLMLLAAAGIAVFGNSLLSGFACLGALLLGAALLLPWALDAGLALLSRGRWQVTTEWVLADARQQVPALSLALMALLLALAANVGVSTMVGSFRATFTGWLDQRLASELYLRAETEDQANTLRDYLIPRADAVLPIWSVPIPVAGQPGRIFGVVPHETYRDHWPLIAALPDAWDQVAEGTGALINEQAARRRNLWPGEAVSLGTGWEMQIVGVYSDYGNPNAQAMVSFDMLRARYPNTPVLRYALRVPESDAKALRQELLERFDLGDDALIDQAAVKADSLRIFEQTFLVTAALNVLTLLVASIAILTSLLTLSTMRLTQLAPVWALGVPENRLAVFELARTALLALLTWALALPVGLALAWVLLRVVNVHAFGWELPMTVFPADWALLALWALLAAGLASLWPILRLTRGSGQTLLRRFAGDR